MSELIWKSRPSQLINFFIYIFLFWTIILPIYSYLKTRFTIFELSKDRLKLKKGILTQKIDETELYRVRDYEILKPFILRLFGLGHLKLITSDKSHPIIILYAIKNPENVLELFRANVEQARKKTGTREVDFT